jgi:hypothetical protein
MHQALVVGLLALTAVVTDGNDAIPKKPQDWDWRSTKGLSRNTNTIDVITVYKDQGAKRVVAATVKSTVRRFPDGLIVRTYQHGKGDLAGTGDVATISVGARKPLLPIVSSLRRASCAFTQRT